MDKFAQALVVSDTHGNRAALNAIVKQYSKVQYVFHLGDMVRDAVYLSDHMKDSCVLNVRGNCDVGYHDADYETIIIKGQRIILTHGHTLGVKYDYSRVLYYAKEHDAQAILFGHTHVPLIENTDGVWLINPGSAGQARGGRETVAILLIGEVGIVPKIIPLHYR